MKTTEKYFDELIAEVMKIGIEKMTFMVRLGHHIVQDHS